MAGGPSGSGGRSVTLPATPSEDGLKYWKQLAIGPIPRHGAPVSSNTAIPYFGLVHRTLPSGATVTPSMKASSPSIGGWKIGGDPLPAPHDLSTHWLPSHSLLTPADPHQGSPNTC